LKDILNQHFKNLPNPLNEGKPVTNSRDTQEVPYTEGIKMLEIFRDFKEETSILDDYEQFEKIEGKKNSSKKAPKS